MWRNPQKTADLVTFTEETLNENLPFLYNESCGFYNYDWGSRIDIENIERLAEGTRSKE